MFEYIVNHCAVDSQEVSESFWMFSDKCEVCCQDSKFAALASRNKSNKSAKTGVGSGGFDGEFRV